MKKVIAAVVLLAVLIGAWWFASPWWTLKGMKEAGEERDAAAFSSYIDFEALRTDMKAETMNAVRREAKERGGKEALDTTFAEAMIGPAIDRVISEEGVEQMFKFAEQAGGSPFPTFQQDELPDIERRGFGTFLVVQERGEPGLIFERSGLGWKLAGIEVPENEAAELAQ